MYLIIDSQYGIYKTKVLSGRIRSMCRRGEVSVVNLATMQGMNASPIFQQEFTGDYSDIPQLPEDFGRTDEAA